MEQQTPSFRGLPVDVCVCVEKEKESTQEKDSDSKNGNPSSRVALWTLRRVIMWSQAIVAGIFYF